MFHVVFALRADASYSIVDCYHDLCHRFSIAIRHEEVRCNYLTSQVKLMQSAHDEIAALPEGHNESPFHLILSRSELAVQLKMTFDDLKSFWQFYSTLETKFSEQFPNTFLLAILSQFSLPISLSELDNPMSSSYQQAQRVQMVIWMLQHRLLTQLHTYVYLIPSERASSSIQNGELIEDTTRTAKTLESSDLNQSEESLLSPSHSKASSVSDEEDLSLREQDSIRQANLTPLERDSILRDASHNSKDDLKNFIRFCPYFRGRHHLEEIMYCENIRRSHLLSLLDKFRNILITCQFEDTAVVALNKRL
ncbi:GATOR complex protein NPRL3 like protein [Argiope bruennichi]|uniref:GATOR complex protein NPRL3 n=1 Tax=Argiope bruennichi TaxID=94029 RepID=A0A8T0EB61_ARGBR|nr:GATOR complex protein NPRL3 like protein [Argiope bruennichi]